MRQQSQQLRRSIRNLKREGFRHIFEFSTPEEIEEITIERQRLWNNLRREHGPFDIIGDVHGCFDELAALLAKLGYQVSVGTVAHSDRVNPVSTGSDSDRVIFQAHHPDGRKAIFLGDLVDRGPKIPEVLRPGDEYG